MNKKSWHRLALSLFGVICTMLIWHIAIERLSGIKPDYVAAFTTLTVNTQYVVGSIIVFMVTGKLVSDWKMNTVSELAVRTERITEEFSERTPSPKHFDGEDVP